MMGLSDRERMSMIRSAVLIQYTRVTDGQTELVWHIRSIAYMLSRVKMLGNSKRIVFVVRFTAVRLLWAEAQTPTPRHLL